MALDKTRRDELNGLWREHQSLCGSLAEMADYGPGWEFDPDL